MKKTKIKVLDIIVIVGLLGLTIFSYFYFYSNADGTVKVKTDDGIYKYSIKENQEISFTGPLGETILLIEKDTARIITSPCQNKTCIEQGEISKGSDVLACLPNHIIITIEGESEVDAVSR